MDDLLAARNRRLAWTLAAVALSIFLTALWNYTQ